MNRRGTQKYVPTANLLGLHTKTPAQIAANAVLRANAAEAAANAAESAANAHRHSIAEFSAKKEQQIQAHTEYLKTRPRSIHGGLGQPNNADQIEHFKRSMQKTWDAQGPKYNSTIFERAIQARKYAVNARKAANNAHIRAQPVPNLLQFPTREEELASLFTPVNTSKVVGGSRTKKQRKTKKRKYRLH